MNIYTEGIFLKGNASKAGLQYVSSRAVVPVEGPWFLFSSSLPSDQKYLQIVAAPGGWVWARGQAGPEQGPIFSLVTPEASVGCWF